MACYDYMDDKLIEKLRNEFEDALDPQVGNLEDSGMCIGCALEVSITCLAEVFAKSIDQNAIEGDVSSLIFGAMRRALDLVIIKNLQKDKLPRELSMALVDMMEAQSMSAEQAIAMMSRRAEIAEQAVLDMRGNMQNEMAASYQQGYSDGITQRPTH